MNLVKEQLANAGKISWEDLFIFVQPYEGTKRVKQSLEKKELKQHLLNNVVFTLNRCDRAGLMNVPKRSFKDMYITYLCMNNKNGNIEAVPVTLQMCYKLHVTEQDLFDAAVSNTAE